MSAFRSRRSLLAAGLGLALAQAAHAAHAAPVAEAPLALQVYNPGAQSLFPVSSVIVSGPREAVLIDAQFQRNDAQALVRRIRATGRRLTAIYVSHSDPDYYFGLDVLRAAFPQARILATPETVAAIAASMDGKRAHWGPILGKNAPARLVLPQVLHGRSLSVDGQALEIRGPEPARSFVWIPTLGAVVGGIPVAANLHVWMADTPTPAARRHWLQTLDAIEALRPATVVPGHALPGADGTTPQGLDSVAFTRAYLLAFEEEAARAQDGAALIAAMRRRFPALGEVSSLELGARVVKGELQWPQ